MPPEGLRELGRLAVADQAGDVVELEVVGVGTLIQGTRAEIGCPRAWQCPLADLEKKKKPGKMGSTRKYQMVRFTISSCICH